MFSVRNIAIFLGLFALNNIIYLTPSFGNPYYGVMLLGLLLLLYKGKFSGTFSGFCLIAVIVCSLLFNDVPSVSKPWMRLLVFIIVICVSGIGLCGQQLARAKLWMFWTLRIGTALVGVLSLPARFIGLGRYQGDGYYCGLTVHSITLGLIASNAFTYLLYVFLTCPDTTQKKVKNLLLIATGLCFVCTLASASRAAVLAALGGGGILLLCLNKLPKSQWKRYVILLAVAMLCSFPLWSNHMKGLKNKNGGSLSSLNMDSRKNYWEAMWQVYCAHPFFGVGFSSIRYNAVDISQVDENNGQVEPGNSWLVVLSMTGTFGGLAILFILIRACLILKQQFALHKERTALLSSLLCGEVLHMCAEGYIYSAGGFGFFNFWCLLGAIYALDELKYQNDGIICFDGYFLKRVS